jgi:hypothetical protein
MWINTARSVCLVALVTAPVAACEPVGEYMSVRNPCDHVVSVQVLDVMPHDGYVGLEFEPGQTRELEYESDLKSVNVWARVEGGPWVLAVDSFDATGFEGEDSVPSVVLDTQSCLDFGSGS